MVLDPMLDSVQIIRRQVRNESEIRANIFINCFLTESVTVRGLTIDQDRLPIPQDGLASGRSGSSIQQ